jgi:isocitrate/isopropylmalate dehydrogenase
MMFEHSFRLPEAAKRIHGAIASALDRGYRTRDLYRQTAADQARYTLASTRQMSDVICKLIEKPDAA